VQSDCSPDQCANDHSHGNAHCDAYLRADPGSNNNSNPYSDKDPHHCSNSNPDSLPDWATELSTKWIADTAAIDAAIATAISAAKFATFPTTQRAAVLSAKPTTV
jgi:hypothetical protein